MILDLSSLSGIKSKITIDDFYVRPEASLN